jgi:hypothetical protein
VTLQAILNCAKALFEHYQVNPNTWKEVMETCEVLLNKHEYERYGEVHHKDGDGNRHDVWARLLKKFSPQDEDIDLSDHKGQYKLCTEAEERAMDACDKLIPVHQLQTYSWYLKESNQPAELEAYCRLLVSVLSLRVCINMAIISRFHFVGALQLQGCCR